jgi:4-amino-4-deoxy-L-arabinose transferase-like glycosyltransferase
MKQWGFIAIVLIVAIPFLAFGVSLDRYPQFYFDEPFLNYPAIRYLEGRGLTYQVSAFAPHGDTVFAYHGPFYPWLQVVIFRLLGVSQFASRIPNFLGAHLAILVLSLSLARRGLWGTAFALALAWAGDRASLEVMIGRMDGMALLFLALGLLGLVRALERQSLRWAALTGGLLGTAVGFHPICAYFVMTALLLFGLLSPAGRKGKMILGCVAGGLIPAALFAWCWSPHLLWSIEQFRWSSRYQAGMRSQESFAKLIRVLHWSRYWWVGLVATIALFFLPVILKGWFTGRPLRLKESRDLLWATAAGFSFTGLLVSVSSAKHPYYLVYFTPWPLIALGVLVESLGEEYRRLRNVAVAVGVLLFLCWVPSLLWNAMRFREAAIHRDKLDQAVFAGKLAGLIPAEARVTGSPELFLVARKAGLNFTPLTWFHERTEVPGETWIVLSREDCRQGDSIELRNLAARVVIFEGEAFPGTAELEYPFTVYGPIRATVK